VLWLAHHFPDLPHDRLVASSSDWKHPIAFFGDINLPVTNGSIVPMDGADKNENRSYPTSSEQLTFSLMGDARCTLRQKVATAKQTIRASHLPERSLGTSLGRPRRVNLFRKRLACRTEVTSQRLRCALLSLFIHLENSS
jgi:hypothetical protein